MTGPVLALLQGPGSAAADAALGLAAKLAIDLSAAFEACFVGSAPLALPACSRAYLAESEDGRALAAAVRSLVEAGGHGVLVAQDAPLPREVAGRLAARSGLPVAARVLSAAARDGAIEVVRSVEGGRRSAKFLMTSNPALLLVDPEASFSPSVVPSRPAECIELPVEGGPHVRVVEERTLDPSEIDLGDAEVVVAGGRGLGPDGFRLLEEVAALLNGAVGASRVAVDLGWAPRSAQVGMTGKTVTPRLYLACGISGAVHHTLGMKDSGFIVAVNNDAAAPMLGLADVAIVADAPGLLRELIAELRRRASSNEPAFAVASASP